MWQLDGSQASLQSPRLRGRLDLAAPAAGLTAVSFKADADREFQSCDAALMQLALSDQTQLVDAYVRGNDLVATYAESADHPCRTQVYWRFESDVDYVGIQLIVSVQTPLLDAMPSLTVTTRLPAPAEMIQAGTVVAPLPASEACYIELADASNIDSTSVRETCITTHLFPGSLEKGVIRRARLLGCFLVPSSAARTARQLHEHFVSSALPLTT